MCLTLIKQCNPLSAGNFLSSTFFRKFFLGVLDFQEQFLYGNQILPRKGLHEAHRGTVLRSYLEADPRLVRGVRKMRVPGHALGRRPLWRHLVLVSAQVAEHCRFWNGLWDRRRSGTLASSQVSEATYLGKEARHHITHLCRENQAREIKDVGRAWHAVWYEHGQQDGSGQEEDAGHICPRL